MKQIKKMVEQVTGYEATDGTIFNDAEECKKYENTCKCVVTSMLNNLKCKMSVRGSFIQELVPMCWNDDETYSILFIKDSNDLDSLNKYLKFMNYPKIVENDSIGHKIIIGFNYDNEPFVCGTPEYMKQKLCEAVDKLVSEDKQEE